MNAPAILIDAETFTYQAGVNVPILLNGSAAGRELITYHAQIYTGAADDLWLEVAYSFGGAGAPIQLNPTITTPVAANVDLLICTGDVPSQTSHNANEYFIVIPRIVLRTNWQLRLNHGAINGSWQNVRWGTAKEYLRTRDVNIVSPSPLPVATSITGPAY